MIKYLNRNRKKFQYWCWYNTSPASRTIFIRHLSYHIKHIKVSRTPFYEEIANSLTVFPQTW